MESILTKLQSRCILSIKGEGKDDYLHGQITIDTKNFDSAKARLAAHCDFKGKMWSLFVTSKTNDAFHLIMPKESTERSLGEFKKYGVFSKVDIQVEENTWEILGATGTEAKSALSALFPALSDEHLSVQSSSLGQVICFNDIDLRYLITLNAEGYKRLLSHYSGEVIDDESTFDMLEIEAGIAYLSQNTVGEYVPQMFNLQALNGIDFNKGCYMGQEVVARTKFLGKNKRALYILQSNKPLDAENLKPGALLEKSIGDNWRRGGVIVRSSSNSKTTKLLAVLANDTQEDDVLRLKESMETLRVLPLPYSIDA